MKIKQEKKINGIQEEKELVGNDYFVCFFIIFKV